ncbi:MAG: hypothetical protein ACFFDK_09580 [Promethearchaeota archaeon]
MKEENKKINSEKEETPTKDDEEDISKEKTEFVDLDWIFDKGWLRTKK